MIQKLNEIGAKALEDVQAAQSADQIEQIRVSVLGKKGALSQVLRGLGGVPAEDRPKIGAAANEWKRKIENLLQLRKESIENEALEASIVQEQIDVTLPARSAHVGALHPITQVMEELMQTFSRIGFDVTFGPEAETDYLCFEAVNIPKDHPARDMQDTFYLGPGVVLRTHTSPVQMRTLFQEKWPVRIICPGAVYRRDNDATHSPMFHQVEGLWVDEGVRMSDLKGVLEFFAKETFGKDTQIRMRPSYFPFVEPGAEVDVSCFRCRQRRSKKSTDRCPICKDTGWVEILGAGMVHPNLFKEAGYDTKKVSGFAFGLGVDRIAMLLYEIPDLRYLFQNDVRFLSQFAR